jgi:hypothetical protein
MKPTFFMVRRISASTGGARLQSSIVLGLKGTVIPMLSTTPKSPGGEEKKKEILEVDKNQGSSRIITGLAVTRCQDSGILALSPSLLLAQR